MQTGPSEQLFRVWGTDNVAYGPLTASALETWIQTHNLTPESWVFSEEDRAWRRLADLADFKDALRTRRSPAAETGIKAAFHLLRSLDLFTGLTDAQVESFARYAEIVRFDQFTRIVQKGDPGDAMFIVLDGEVRAYLIVDGRECTLSSVGPGEFIGEISLLDEGPRSADLAANVDTTLLRLPVTQFRALLREAPALAAPFLLALSRTVVRRIRSTTQRYQDSIHYMGRKIAGWA